MPDFIERQRMSECRDIIGLLNAVEALLARIDLGGDMAVQLCEKVDERCTSLQKSAQDMASRCNAPEEG